MATMEKIKQVREITLHDLAQGVLRHKSAVFPVFSLCLILVMLVPLPPFLMDILIAANITIAAVVLMTVMYMNGPLEFSAFPSMLLAMTLFRLVLNTATTRLILTNADAGPAAAGDVIRVFGEFVAGGSLMVGVVIFAIIVAIQFIVITKGATRIAEVAARFTLDGMPGKQMAVDADLNAGLIDEPEARRRREEITSESDFYGAMDGASKFVRGDAIAGLVITFINIAGGIYIGMVEQGMTIMDTLRVFTTLTIGDGLVSQIPAFIISIAAALIVTRSASKKNLGDEMAGQLTQQPVALVLTAIFLFVLMLTPLPWMPLLGLAAPTLAIATIVSQRRKKNEQKQAEATKVKAKPAEKPEKLILPDAMEIGVGYGLIRLVDRKQGGYLLDRITNMRRQIAQELGIIVPAVRIRDNIQLQPNQYEIRIRGSKIAEGEVLPGHLLAIDAGAVIDRVHGIDAEEPAFGLPAVWIDEASRQEAEQRNYTVVEASSVLSTHLTETIKRHADELLTRQEVNALLDTLKERSPNLVEELIPQVVKPGELQKVLQLLLRERIPVRDLETILETIGDWAPRTKDPDVLVEYVRAALARTLCDMNRGSEGKLVCITLDPKLEETIGAHIEVTDRGTYSALPPSVQSKIIENAKIEVERIIPTLDGRTPVILCAPRVRLWLRRMLEASIPQVAVMSFNEVVRGFGVETRGMLVIDHES